MEIFIHYVIWGALFFIFVAFVGRREILFKPPQDTAVDDKDPKHQNDRLRWIDPDADFDPVCGKRVHTGNAKTSVYDGDVFYFCSRECRERFEAAPNTYPRVVREGMTIPKRKTND